MSSDGTEVPIVITETKGLLGVLELDAIKFYELHAESLDPEDADGEDHPVEFKTAHRFAPMRADYRIAMTVRTPVLVARIDAAAMFASETALDVSDEILIDFGDNVALMTLFPYLRQAVTDLSQRLGQALILPVLPRGALSFAPVVADDETPTADVPTE